MIMVVNTHSGMKCFNVKTHVSSHREILKIIVSVVVDARNICQYPPYTA
jgi:hypothetical protein